MRELGILISTLENENEEEINKQLNIIKFFEQNNVIGFFSQLHKNANQLPDKLEETLLANYYKQLNNPENTANLKSLINDFDHEIYHSSYELTEAIKILEEFDKSDEKIAAIEKEIKKEFNKVLNIISNNTSDAYSISDYINNIKSQIDKTLELSQTTLDNYTKKLQKFEQEIRKQNTPMVSSKQTEKSAYSIEAKKVSIPLLLASVLGKQTTGELLNASQLREKIIKERKFIDGQITQANNIKQAINKTAQNFYKMANEISSITQTEKLHKMQSNLYSIMYSIKIYRQTMGTIKYIFASIFTFGILALINTANEKKHAEISKKITQLEKQEASIRAAAQYNIGTKTQGRNLKQIYEDAKAQLDKLSCPKETVPYSNENTKSQSQATKKTHNNQSDKISEAPTSSYKIN